MDVNKTEYPSHLILRLFFVSSLSALNFSSPADLQEATTQKRTLRTRNEQE